MEAIFLLLCLQVLLFNGVHHVSAQCVASADPSILTTGDSSEVCVLFSNGTNTFSGVFTPDVDVFSRFVIKDSYSSYKARVAAATSTDSSCSTPTKALTTLESLKFDVFVNGNQSIYAKRYSWTLNSCNGNGNVNQLYFVTNQTVVITLNKGVVEQVAYDDVCYLCSKTSSECVSNALTSINNSSDNISEQETLIDQLQKDGVGYNCVVTGDKCITGVSGYNACDFALYIVWRGTDKNGDILKSSIYRFSRYHQFSSILSSASSYLTSTFT